MHGKGTLTLKDRKTKFSGTWTDGKCDEHADEILDAAIQWETSQEQKAKAKEERREEIKEYILAEKICFRRDENVDAWLEGIKKLSLTNRAKYVRITPKKVMKPAQQKEQGNILVDCMQEFKSKGDQKSETECEEILKYLKDNDLHESWLAGIKLFELEKKAQYVRQKPLRKLRTKQLK